MELSKILAISGKPGLYKIISQTRNSIIVESLIDGKRLPAYATQKISNLEDIAIFTSGEEIPLGDVFKRIYDKIGKEAIPDMTSDNSKLKGFFEEIVPEYDKERVYTSDIKKVVSWYNILLKNDLIEFDKIKTTEEVTEETPENKSETTEEILENNKQTE